MIKSPLTTREKAVALCLVAGMTAKEVSRKLDLSVRTVEDHRKSIKKKVQAKTICQVGWMLGKILNISLTEKLLGLECQKNLRGAAKHPPIFTDI